MYIVNEGLVKEVNIFRTKEDHRILWADYEAYQIWALLQYAHPTSLYRYCSAAQLTCIAANRYTYLDKEENKEELVKDYTHIAIFDHPQNLQDHILILLTKRPVAIDQIASDKNRWLLKLVEFSKQEHTWGMKLKPLPPFAVNTYVNVTPPSIRNRHSHLEVEIDKKEGAFEQITVLGGDFSPFYGQKIESDNPFPSELFVIYRVKFFQSTSWLQKQMSEDEGKLMTRQRTRFLPDNIFNHKTPVKPTSTIKKAKIQEQKRMSVSMRKRQTENIIRTQFRCDQIQEKQTSGSEEIQLHEIRKQIKKDYYQYRKTKINLSESSYKKYLDEQQDGNSEALKKWGIEIDQYLKKNSLNFEKSALKQCLQSNLNIEITPPEFSFLHFFLGLDHFNSLNTQIEEFQLSATSLVIIADICFELAIKILPELICLEAIWLLNPEDINFPTNWMKLWEHARTQGKLNFGHELKSELKRIFIFSSHLIIKSRAFIDNFENILTLEDIPMIEECFNQIKNYEHFESLIYLFSNLKGYRSKFDLIKGEWQNQMFEAYPLKSISLGGCIKLQPKPMLILYPNQPPQIHRAKELPPTHFNSAKSVLSSSSRTDLFEYVFIVEGIKSEFHTVKKELPYFRWLNGFFRVVIQFKNSKNISWYFQYLGEKIEESNKYTNKFYQTHFSLLTSIEIVAIYGPDKEEEMTSNSMLHFGVGEPAKVRIAEKDLQLEKDMKIRLTVQIKNNQPYNSIFQYICADWGRFIQYEKLFDPQFAKSKKKRISQLLQKADASKDFPLISFPKQKLVIYEDCFSHEECPRCADERWEQIAQIPELVMIQILSNDILDVEYEESLLLLLAHYYKILYRQNKGYGLAFRCIRYNFVRFSSLVKLFENKKWLHDVEEFCFSFNQQVKSVRNKKEGPISKDQPRIYTQHVWDVEAESILTRISQEEEFKCITRRYE